MIFDGIMVELRYLQEILSVDYSNVIQKYNDYVYNDTDKYTEAILSLGKEDELEKTIAAQNEDDEDIGELEELEEVI